MLKELVEILVPQFLGNNLSFVLIIPLLTYIFWKNYKVFYVFSSDFYNF